MSAACWQTDPSNAPFQHDMDAWAAISNRTYIWDCEPASLDTQMQRGCQDRSQLLILGCASMLPSDVVNFQAYVQPFPNYYVLAPNIRYYLDHGVRGMYEEGNGEQRPYASSQQP